MNIAVNFRHMDPSPALQRYATEKLDHVVGKYVSGQDVESHVTFEVEKIWHIANFTININGLTVKSVVKTQDMHEAIDLALEKVERQVRRYKDRIRNHKPDARKRPLTEQVLSVADEGEGEEAVAGEAQVAAPEQALTPEARTAPFMTADQAIMQLEMLHAPFFLFTNESTERVNIVYPRGEGAYGLIEVEPSHH